MASRAIKTYVFAFLQYVQNSSWQTGKVIKWTGKITLTNLPGTKSMNSLMLFRFFMLLGDKLTVVRSMICCFYGAILLTVLRINTCYLWVHISFSDLLMVCTSWISNVGMTPYPYHGNNNFDTTSTNIDLSQHMGRTYPYRPSVTRPLQPLQLIAYNTQSTKYTSSKFLSAALSCSSRHEGICKYAWKIYTSN